MPTFEFQFRREFAQQDAPRIEVEADRVFARQVSDGVIVEADRRVGDGEGDWKNVFSTASDRLLWWRPLPEEDGAKKPAMTIPLDLPNPEPDTSRSP